jgi:hypothetical protein
VTFNAFIAGVEWYKNISAKNSSIEITNEIRDFCKTKCKADCDDHNIRHCLQNPASKINIRKK